MKKDSRDLRVHVVSTSLVQTGTQAPGSCGTVLKVVMSPAEIRRATKRARKCMASDYQDCEP